MLADFRIWWPVSWRSSGDEIAHRLLIVDDQDSGHRHLNHRLILSEQVTRPSDVGLGVSVPQVERARDTNTMAPVTFYVGGLAARLGHQAGALGIAIEPLSLMLRNVLPPRLVDRNRGLELALRARVRPLRLR